jgi:intein/homing endonuclease
MYGGPGDPTGGGSTFGFGGTISTDPVTGNPAGESYGSNDDTTSTPEDFVCLLEDMMVMLNGRISEVTNVKVGDTVSYGTVIEVMHKHMRTGYYVINDELKITNDHPVLANGSWKRTEDVIVGDYINNVKVESIKYVEKIVPTVYIGVNTMSYDVYCKENIYTVHGHYKEKMQKVS